MRTKPLDSKFRSGPALLGARAFAAISAVEGLRLSSAGHKRVHASAPLDQRRAEVLRAYSDIKGLK